MSETLTTLEAVRAELLKSADLKALVSDRIYPARAEQECARPFIVLTVVSELPQHSLTSTAADRAMDARLQVDVYGTSHRKTHDVAELVDEVLGELQSADLSVVRLSLTESWEAETSLHRVSMDFSVWR